MQHILVPNVGLKVKEKIEELKKWKIKYEVIGTAIPYW